MSACGFVADLLADPAGRLTVVVQDHLICASDWADLLPRLTRPTRIWQGTDDNNVPAESTRWLAGRIPGAELTLLPGAGHTLTDQTWPEAHQWLLATATT
jgi:pimeloyl-ACP methyl ester carboxylesterase